MASEKLKEELKDLIITTLNLEDIKVSDIKDDEALFGEGLGLDSVDALELSLAISQKYNVVIDKKVDNVREIFANVENLELNLLILLLTFQMPYYAPIIYLL